MFESTGSLGKEIDNIWLFWLVCDVMHVQGRGDFLPPEGYLEFHH